MKIISGLTSQPKQAVSLQIADGTQVSLLLEYRPQQTGWFFSLAWGVFTINGCRLTASPNALRKWKNLFPFGLGVFSAGNVEPLNQTDLSDGTTTLVLLEAADVGTIETISFPGY